MSAEIFHDKIQLCCGDSLHFLQDQPDSRYDSIVTDPPYALVSIQKRYGAENSKPSADVYGRGTRGFMGKQWDTGETAFSVEFWRECFRVLKPGAHVVAFGGARTYHRLACAIEDAGFEIRDQVQWLYGSGFPKSHNVSKNIDKAAGLERAVVSEGAAVKRMIPGADQNKEGWIKDNGREYIPTVTAAATSEAEQWEGWGTALKPAVEPICIARKPLIGTVAQNVLQHGTGAINIDGCRVGTESTIRTSTDRDFGLINDDGWKSTSGQKNGSESGRWPANIIHDGSEEVIAAFPDAPGQLWDSSAAPRKTGNVYGAATGPRTDLPPRDNGGSAARFFYQAKADSDDRLGSKHPTVKPVDLMQWLVRLVTPKGGLVLDPFAGTGTTAEACFREGMRCMLIERETQYQADIRRRMALLMGGPEERRRESIKAKTADQPVDHGPLFEVSA